MDYRKLCLELFGTDDVDELTKIAQTYREKNPRKAGRKKKFTAEDVQTIRSLLENGMTMQEAAKRFNTSRQVIMKYRSLMWIFSIKESWFRIKQRTCSIVHLASLSIPLGMISRRF